VAATFLRHALCIAFRMKIFRCFPLLVMLCGLLQIARADSILLSDNFSGGSLDLSKWTTILPTGTASVVQSGGAITTTGRGILATANGYNPSYIINGSFTMLHDWEHFNIGFRTDLSFLPEPDLYNTLSGMFVSFANDGNSISIQGRGYTDHTVKSFELTTGETYFFSIFDDGLNIKLSINGITELSATSTVATGNHVAFYSREFPFTATSLDSVNIVGVPDVVNSSLLLVLGLGLLAILKVRFSRRIQYADATKVPPRSN
jgi:hypothetical protein